MQHYLSAYVGVLLHNLEFKFLTPLNAVEKVSNEPEEPIDKVRRNGRKNERFDGRTNHGETFRAR